MENLVVGQLIILLLAFFLISHHLSAWFLISHHLSAWYCKEKFGLGRLCKVWNVKIKNMFKDISVFPLISSQLLEPRILLISLKKGNKSGGCNLLYARKIGMILQWKEQPEKDLVSHATKFLYNYVRLEISVYDTWILVYVKSCGQSSCCNLFNYLFHSYANSFLNFSHGSLLLDISPTCNCLVYMMKLIFNPRLYFEQYLFRWKLFKRSGNQRMNFL